MARLVSARRELPVTNSTGEQFGWNSVGKKDGRKLPGTLLIRLVSTKCSRA